MKENPRWYRSVLRPIHSRDRSSVDNDGGSLRAGFKRGETMILSFRLPIQQERFSVSCDFSRPYFTLLEDGQ